MIGSFGDIVFEVSDKRIRTINDLQRTTSGRWATHEIQGQQPISEFIGPGQDVVSFNMTFSITHGLNPKDEVVRLISMCREGRVHKLFVGSWCLGRMKWLIESVGQSYEQIDHDGNISQATVNVTLKEYK